MTLAALYDIHGNLPALEAAVRDLREAGADEIVVGGDVVPGPMPNQALDYLLALELPTHFIIGNGEVAVLAASAGNDPGVPEAFRENIDWVAQQLGDAHRRTMASWPKTLGRKMAGLGDVLFCHATPRSENEIFVRSTPEERVLPAFARVQEPIVVCGHTHMQFERMIGQTRVVNAGSVGMPFGEPGAYWLLVADGKVQLRRSAYSLGDAAETIRATDYPQAADFAARSVLQPPSEKQMLELFGQQR